jgi:hypothetical protein
MREAKVDNRIVVAGPSLLDVDVGRVCYATEQAHDPFGEETLERIKGDSFYGQTHVSLPEIEAPGGDGRDGRLSGARAWTTWHLAASTC